MFQTTINRLLGMLLLLTLAATGARAANSYWGTNDVGSLSGDYTNTLHWTPAAPGTADHVYFTNNQASAYTVTLSTSVTNGPLKVWDDSVNLNLNGYRLWTKDTLWGGQGTTLLTNQNVARTVKIYSTSDTNVIGGNVAVLSDNTWVGGFTFGQMLAGTVHNTTVTRQNDIIIDDSGGYPVTVQVSNNGLWIGDVNLTVSGAGTVFRSRYGGAINGNVVVSDGALLDWADGYPLGIGSGCMKATTTVNNATLRTTAGVNLGAGASYGWASSGTLIVSNNSTWTDAGLVQVGQDGLSLGYGGVAYSGSLIVDGSTFTGQRMTLGGELVVTGNWGPGYAEIRNGATATLSNNVVISQYNRLAKTNTLVLNGATIRLGGVTAGALTNYGIMKASGTITGLGSTPALLYTGPAPTGTGGVFEVGSSLGTLTLNNVNLEFAAGSITRWEFSDTGLDQIILNGGAASLLGTNLFSLASGAPAPAPGAAYGLNKYDFLVGSNITWNPQYANITNLLSSYSLVDGLDYRFGLVDLGNGLQALRLEFVPEPSTALLLLGGGLLLFRLRGQFGGQGRSPRPRR